MHKDIKNGTREFRVISEILSLQNPEEPLTVIFERIDGELKEIHRISGMADQTEQKLLDTGVLWVQRQKS